VHWCAGMESTRSELLLIGMHFGVFSHGMGVALKSIAAASISNGCGWCDEGMWWMVGGHLFKVM